MNTKDKELVADILAKSFIDNQSIQFVVKQDKHKVRRLNLLMKYSIYYGETFGKVYLSDTRNACAIILDSRKKRTTFASVLWDIRLVFGCMGISNVKKVLKRETLIKQNHPKIDFIHLWYIGVNPDHQGNGLGTQLMQQIIQDAKSMRLPIYLETSNVRNHKFYHELGFNIIGEMSELGYPLKMFLKEH